MKVRKEFEDQLRALRDEMGAASRRATVAENQLELMRAEVAQVRTQAADAGLEIEETTTTSTALEVPPLQMVVIDPDAEPITALEEFMERMNVDTDRLMRAASVAASRMHSQAELDLARAKEEAVTLLRSATQEAEDLLAAAVAAIERDTAITQATREQAERDGAAAAAMRAEARRLLTEVEAERDRAKARAEAEAKKIVEAAEREAAAALTAVRKRLADEVVSLRKSMDRTRDSFESFLESHPEGVPGSPDSIPESHLEGVPGSPASTSESHLERVPGSPASTSELQLTEPIGEDPEAPTESAKPEPTTDGSASKGISPFRTIQEPPARGRLDPIETPPDSLSGDEATEGEVATESGGVERRENRSQIERGGERRAVDPDSGDVDLERDLVVTPGPGDAGAGPSGAGQSGAGSSGAGPSGADTPAGDTGGRAGERDAHSSDVRTAAGSSAHSRAEGAERDAATESGRAPRAAPTVTGRPTES